MASTGLSQRALTAPALALPAERWRLALVIVGLAGVVLTASGLAANALFEQPTMTKQLATLGAPLLLLGCALVRHPLRAPMAVVLLGVPFVLYQASFGNVTASALVAPLLLAVLLATLAPTRIRLITPRVVIVLVLIALPVALAEDLAAQIQLVGFVALVVWLVRRTAENDGGLRFVLVTLVLGCAVQAALGLWQARTGQRFSLLTGSTSTFGSDYFFSFGDVNRPTAAFTDPISFGNVLAIGIPIAAALAVSLRSVAMRLAAVGAAAVMATALILTLSRMSWVGAAVGVIVTVALLPGRLRAAGALGTAAVVAATIAVAVGMEGTDIVDRAQSLSNPTSSSASTTADTDRGRVRIWEATLDVFEANPVSGVGMGDLGDELIGRVGFGSGRSGHAHSVYLQTLATAGLLGALALLLIAWEVCRRTVRTLRAPILGARDWERRILAAGIAGSLAALAVACATDTTPRYLQVAGIVAILLGCALSLGRRTDPT